MDDAGLMAVTGKQLSLLLLCENHIEARLEMLEFVFVRRPNERFSPGSARRGM